MKKEKEGMKEYVVKYLIMVSLFSHFKINLFSNISVK